MKEATADIENCDYLGTRKNNRYVQGKCHFEPVIPNQNSIPDSCSSFASSVLEEIRVFKEQDIALEVQGYFERRSRSSGPININSDSTKKRIHAKYENMREGWKEEMQISECGASVGTGYEGHGRPGGFHL